MPIIVSIIILVIALIGGGSAVLQYQNGIRQQAVKPTIISTPTKKIIPTSSPTQIPTLIPAISNPIETNNELKIVPTITQKLPERILVVLPPNEQKYYCIRGAEDSIYKLRSLIDTAISNNKNNLEDMDKKITECNKVSLYPESVVKCISDITKIKDEFKRSSDSNVASMEIEFRKVLTEACI